MSPNPSTNGTPRYTQTSDYEIINLSLTMKGIFRGFDTYPSTILDIGCGDARELSCCESHGVDLLVGLDIATHKQWKSIKNAHFVMADAHHLPFKPGSFQFIFCKDVFHHIPDDRQKVIKEALKACQIHGVFRIIEANRYHVNPILVYQRDKSHDHFTQKDLQRLVKPFSFEPIYSYELLPYFSSRKRDFFWNGFVLILFMATTWNFSRKLQGMYIRTRQLMFKDFLNYFVLSKKVV